MKSKQKLCFTCKYCKKKILPIDGGAWVWSCRIRCSRYTSSELVAGSCCSILLLVGFYVTFSMTFGPNIWSSRSGCCYLSRVSAVSRKPNVHFKRHRESLMLNILSMTIALNISLSLCRHCWIACECRSSRSRNDQFRAHPIYVIYVSLAMNDILNHNGKCDVHTVTRICFLKY